MRGEIRARAPRASAVCAVSSAARPPWPSAEAVPRMPGPGPATTASQRAWTRPWWSAPGGEWSHAVLAECRSQGMRPLDWSVDPRDWSRPGSAAIIRTIMTKTVPGSIILEHDGGGNRAQTVQALTVALPRLLDQGYRFVQP